MDLTKPLSGRRKLDLTLDDVRAINAQPKVPLVDLERAIARADALGAEAKADRAQLDTARPALLLTGTDEQLAEHDGATAAFSRQSDRAAALAGALRERAEVARSELAEVERVKRYDAAVALAAAVPAAVEAEYRDLVRVGRSIVERIARARAAVMAVNADLPEGRAQLADPEDFRYLPDQPKRVTSARHVKLYVESNGQIIEDQSRVKPRWSVDAHGRPQADKSVPQKHPADLGFNGEYETPSYGRKVRDVRTEVHVRRLDFVEFESVAAVTHRHVAPFATELTIPALFDLHPPAWSFDRQAPIGNVMHVLETPPVPLTPSSPSAPVFDRKRLDRFEQDWGPLSKLGIAVEDGTEEAAQRQSGNRADGYQVVRSTREVTGNFDPSGPAGGSWLHR